MGAIFYALKQLRRPPDAGQTGRTSQHKPHPQVAALTGVTQHGYRGSSPRQRTNTRPSYLGASARDWLTIPRTAARVRTGQLTRVATKGLGEVVDMARAKRICPKPGCPHPVNKRYCADHEREYEAKRGTSTQRGYDSKHQSLRKQWRQRIDRGGVSCASCGKPIHPGTEFDLGHTEDRTAYKGAEHVHCNRSEGGRRGRATQTL